MKLLIITVAGAAILGGNACAQSRLSEPQVLEEDARSGQPTVGPLQTTDPRTEMYPGERVIQFPGEGNPYGAKGGAIPGVPNPDRVPEDTPGGQSDR